MQTKNLGVVLEKRAVAEKSSLSVSLGLTHTW